MTEEEKELLDDDLYSTVSPTLGMQSMISGVSSVDMEEWRVMESMGGLLEELNRVKSQPSTDSTDLDDASKSKWWDGVQKRDAERVQKLEEDTKLRKKQLEEQRLQKIEEKKQHLKEERRKLDAEKKLQEEKEEEELMKHEQVIIKSIKRDDSIDWDKEFDVPDDFKFQIPTSFSQDDFSLPFSSQDEDDVVDIGAVAGTKSYPEPIAEESLNNTADITSEDVPLEISTVVNIGIVEKIPMQLKEEGNFAQSPVPGVAALNEQQTLHEITEKRNEQEMKKVREEYKENDTQFSPPVIAHSKTFSEDNNEEIGSIGLEFEQERSIEPEPATPTFAPLVAQSTTFEEDNDEEYYEDVNLDRQDEHLRQQRQKNLIKEQRSREEQLIEEMNSLSFNSENMRPTHHPNIVHNSNNVYGDTRAISDAKVMSEKRFTSSAQQQYKNENSTKSENDPFGIKASLGKCMCFVWDF